MSQLQEVFEYYLTKQTERSSFVFTRKLHPASGKLPCAEYGYQHCQIENIRSLLQAHLKDLPMSKDSKGWQKKENRRRRMGLLTWLIIHDVEVTDKQLQQAMDEILGPLYKLVNANDVAGIEEFLKYVPALHYYDFWVEEAIDTLQCDKPGVFVRRCVFLDVLRNVENFATFLKQKSKSKYILTGSDWRKAMEITKISKLKDQTTQQSLDIKKSLQSFSNDLKNFMGKELGGRFNALGKQMQTMADFDRRKSQADVNFITGRLEEFDKIVTEYTEKISSKMGRVLDFAIATAGLSLTQKTAQLVTETLRIANPISAVLGTTDPNAVIDRANDVAEAAVKVAKAKKLMDIFERTMRQVAKIGKAAAANNAQQTIVKKLKDKIAAKYSKTSGKVDEKKLKELSDKFLTIYDGYSPQLMKGDITEMGSLLGTLLGDACDIAEGEVVAASAATAGVIANSGDCQTGQSDIEKLTEVYGQIYDFQFDMMDSLAEVVRGNVAYASAAALTVPFQKVNNKLSEAINYQVMSMKVLIVYRIHNMELINRFCNFMAYVGGGEEPSECKMARKKLNDQSIDKLIPLKPLKCSKVRKAWVRIPTKPSHENDTAFIDLNAIYSGRQVSFKIPNAQWLVDHKWINKADKSNFVYYLRDLQIILPDVVDRYREVRTTVDVVNAVKLVPEKYQPQYILSGPEVTKIHYSYQDLPDLCDEDKKKSLYDYCRDENNKDTDICVISKTEPKQVSPSVFSHFVIKSSFDGQGDMINFTTPIEVLAKLRLCIMCKGGKCRSGYKKSEVEEEDENRSGAVTGRIRSPSKCCVLDKSKKQYYDRKKRSCQDCPKGSEPVKTGHYCHHTNKTASANQ